MNDSQLTHLATVALESYGVTHAHLTRLGGSSNTNFRVRAGDTSLVLRLHTSAQHDRATIASELAWLRRLRADSSLVLPTPLVNLNGDFVTSVAAGGTRIILCTCMTWVEGRIPPTADAMTDEQLANAGAVMASLHQHAQQFYLPDGFTRPAFDTAHFRQRLVALVTALSTIDFVQGELESFQRNTNRIIEYLARMERTHDTFGLIHADFHSGNYVLYHHEVRIIDFDRCGFGFYVYDLILAWMELGEHQRRIFVQGYERVMSLPVAYSSQAPIFLCLAYLDNLGFLVAKPEELMFVVAEMSFAIEAVHHAVRMMSEL